jgi:hypothetical protein
MEMVDGIRSEFLLSPSPSDPGDVREALAKSIPNESAALLDRAMELIGELFASLRDVHTVGGDDHIALKVLPVDGSVRIEIRDQGTGAVLSGLRQVQRPSSHGWSPHLLSRVADRWGLVSSAEGAWIWFELDAPYPRS